jgi:hypothetical protein
MAPKFRVIAERFENINRALVAMNSDVGLNEYRLYLPGKRYSGAVCATAAYGLLTENGSEVRLFVGGVEYAPHDKIRPPGHSLHTAKLSN